MVHNVTDEEFIEALEKFNRNLLESQQDLEPEFQKIINENIWDLYDCENNS